MQALPPQVWNSLQDSAGEVLQAMASAVDRAMEQPHMTASLEAQHSPLSAGSSQSGSNVTCIAMPVPSCPTAVPPASHMVQYPFLVAYDLLLV